MTRAEPSESYDVLIVGAGVSGLGAACHLQRECPGKRFVIVEARDAIGGTWDLFRFPGIRSDSDLYTYAYDFKPWRGPSIATGVEILRYLHEVVDENELERHIRFGHRVTGAAWSTADARWTVEIEGADGQARHLTAGFLFMCQGYFAYEAGYRPAFPGEENFQGAIIHPQQWPQGLDYRDKRLVVIGSGATAATMVPALAEQAAHVTLLQRSPSYYLPVEIDAADELIDELRTLQVPDEWIYEIKRRKNLEGSRRFLERALTEPEAVRQELIDTAAELLPDEYDVDTHFTPRYAPWRERLCLLPDGDMLKSIASGKASVVTGHIAEFVENGILLESGQVIPADIIVTATGIELCALGNVRFTVDGDALELSNSWTYRGIMISDVPNLAWTFGYIRSSWTLRADLIAHFVCRLLKHMDEAGAKQCTPRLRPEDHDMPASAFIDASDFAPGYMRRGTGRLPKQGDREPWVNGQNYYLERDTLPELSFDDGVLQFESLRRQSPGG